MDLRRPLRVITPTLDGDVLGLLAGGELKLTGREIGRRIGASQEGVRQTLDRLVRQGIVLRERAGNAYLYQLNRQHLAAPCIEQLASLRLQLIGRLRQVIEAWRIPPAAAVLFGSAARGDAEQTSDIDILLIRRARIDADEPLWREQVVELESLATALTGNDTRVTEYSNDEVERLRGTEPLLEAAGAEGIELFGSMKSLRRRKRRGRS